MIFVNPFFGGINGNNAKIIEDTKVLFELQTFAGSSEQAKNMVDNWKNNASVIYPKILEILSNNSSEEQTRTQ